MLNKELLASKIKERGYTLENFAKELGINPATLYRKMTGESDFTRAEIQTAKNILALDVNSAEAIFFAK